MFITVSDPHEVLDEVFGKLRIDNRQPALVKSRWPAVSSPFRPMRILIVAARSFAMIVDVMRATVAGKQVIVREFWNVPLLFMAPLLLAWRRRILWNVNHNLRSGSGECPAALSLAARLGFQFLLFDGSAAVAGFQPHVRRAFRTPLFPMTDRSPDGRIRREVAVVALVGDMRPEKIAARELELIVHDLARLPGVRVQVGVRSGTAAAAVLPEGVALCDTSTRKQYLDLLAESDIVVVMARRDAYYYRNSGTVLDAISCGAWPVVPAFPVLQVQVGLPAKVGSTYDSLAEIAGTVADALADLGSMENRRALYFAGRGPVCLASGAAGAGMKHD